MASSLSLRMVDGDCHKLAPTTLAELGLGEEALEHAIETNIDLLALEDSGLRFAEHAVLRQVSFRGPRGGMLRPDLMILTDAGHVILVEVKRHGNAELANRSVLAQLIDDAGTRSIYGGRWHRCSKARNQPTNATAAGCKQQGTPPGSCSRGVSSRPCATA